MQDDISFPAPLTPGGRIDSPLLVPTRVPSTAAFASPLPKWPVREFSVYVISLFVRFSFPFSGGCEDRCQHACRYHRQISQRDSLRTKRANCRVTSRYRKDTCRRYNERRRPVIQEIRSNATRVKGHRSSGRGQATVNHCGDRRRAKT